MINKDTTTLHNLPSALSCEWIETNGLGGWASSTIIGCNTRRYHGLLVAATDPPTERMVLVSKMDETLVCGQNRFELGTNDYGTTVYPKGYTYMTGFSRGLFPVFEYKAGGITFRKTIGMIPGENTVILIYDIIKAPASFTLEWRPLLAVRNYHQLVHANPAVNRQAVFENAVFKTTAYEAAPTVFIQIPGACYQAAPDWFYHFNYRVEQYRGLDFEEDLFTPGNFSLVLEQGASVGIVLSTNDPTGRDAHALLAVEEKRKRNLLLDKTFRGSTEQVLTLAADQFIVKRSIPPNAAGESESVGATVIAGYHWFTDWGRDTMISLPGLTLSTGRYEDAKKILSAFAGSVSMGMLPNRFRDDGQGPEYNTADGTLWYFIAVYKYLQASSDMAFVLDTLLPVLKDIIAWHYKGTRYHIGVAADGLLYAGEKGQQLTWMDAKIYDWVVTPRMGKPVEIQALWYNALSIFAHLLELNNQISDAAAVAGDAARLKENFGHLFWYAAGNYLCDAIDEYGHPDTTLRPNQLFAISLPFALIEGEKAIAVTDAVRQQLYTPVGLRTLSNKDPRYKAVYGGDRLHRDSAYHQGTVWSWLLGAWVDAIIKTLVTDGRTEAQQVIRHFHYHLSEACLGSVSEIFDAEAPHHPRGCIAQAWGVAEILRIIKEYNLAVD
ncbi:MAG: amylo-alpha-1,6-glucosidase [Bacteroidota bacterium]